MNNIEPYRDAMDILAWPNRLSGNRYEKWRRKLAALHPSGQQYFTACFNHIPPTPSIIDRSDLPMHNDARVRVDGALSFVANVSPPASSFVNLLLTTIELTVDEFDDVPGSFSDAARIGTASIVNAHVADATIAYLADSLLHESVHALIYSVERELRHDILYSRPSLCDERLVSPWTRRSLPARHFVHACFVWFALERFWSIATVCSPSADNGEALRFHAIAQAGFSTCELETQLAATSAPIAAKEAIAAAAACVRKRTRYVDSEVPTESRRGEIR